MSKLPARQMILRIGRAISPAVVDRILAYRIRRHIIKLNQRLGLDRIQRKYVEQKGLVVLAGPFAGMKYVGQAAGSMAVPKLIGSYEMELHAAVEAAIRHNPAVIVDVGAAEGYYAVGFARRLSEARVIAFDTDVVARQLCKKKWLKSTTWKIVLKFAGDVTRDT